MVVNLNMHFYLFLYYVDCYLYSIRLAMDLNPIPPRVIGACSLNFVYDDGMVYLVRTVNWLKPVFPTADHNS